MELSIQTPKQALKAFLKQKPLRSEIDVFKINLLLLLQKMVVIAELPKDETEEHLKNNLRDFLRETYYKDLHAVNTKDKKGLVIHLGKTIASDAGVIIEAKRPANTGEMITEKHPNRKALHELILYYLQERHTNNNIQLKHLVITNVNEWYIIDANFFDKHIYRNTQILKLYETKINDKKDNPFFYEEIEKILNKIDFTLPCIYFNIIAYKKYLKSDEREDYRELIALYKILSPQHLLKIESPNDSNSLNENFYRELLHIVGLEETKEGGKIIISRKKEKINSASLIEKTIEAIKTENVLHRVRDLSSYGSNKDEQFFSVALELCITWINRILFLKLLEGQLLIYHQGDKDYKFLNTEKVNDFHELFNLFHKVLLVTQNERSELLKTKYANIPYLNSSLFEISELEDQTIKINAIENNGHLDLINTTILKNLKRNNSKLSTLDYLFRFLDAYDFASEGIEDVQEDNKALINASVLGKVFEKINGYKNGSVFTPAFITMYMCRQSIRLAVVQKFNEALSEKGQVMFETFDDLKHYSSKFFKSKDILKFNAIINSLRICDPAVGSGHFLVSALNEIITIKAEMGILADNEGNYISNYNIEIINDELVIYDKHSDMHEYKLKNGKPLTNEVHHFQKTLFHEKQTIIENCLFGVDINPNSVKICMLRLWIELLKNAYYKEETDFTELETLPNIDINIKCGNSLLSKFSLTDDLREAFKKGQYTIESYKLLVQSYRKCRDSGQKSELVKVLRKLKEEYTSTIRNRDPRRKKISELRGQLLLLDNNFDLFAKKISDEQKNTEKKRVTILLAQREQELEEAEGGKMYKNAFEWRFEFPEVLNNNGDFEGFDLMIGNPPYIRQEEVKELSSYFENYYKETFSGKADIYVFFYQRGLELLKNNGIINYITSGKFLEASYGKPLIHFLLNESEIKTIINFNDLNVFDGVSAYPLIFFASKSKKDEFHIPYYNLKELPKTTLQQKLSITTPLNITKSILIQNDYKFVGNTITNIINKLRQDSISLHEFCGLPIVGVKTGYNEGFITKSETGIYVKPYVFGKDIKKYQPVKSNYNIIFPYNKDFTLASYEKDAAIFTYLLTHKEKLSNRAIIKDGIIAGTKCWYEYQQVIKSLNYDEEHITYPNVSFGNNFTLCKEAVIDMTAFIIKSNNKYLLAVLNSRIVAFLMNIWCIRRRGDYLEYKVQYVEKIPIKNLSSEAQQPYIALVDKIMKAKEQGLDSIELERQVDTLIYKLYELTDDEIKIIENQK